MRYACLHVHVPLLQHQLLPPHAQLAVVVERGQVGHLRGARREWSGEWAAG